MREIERFREEINKIDAKIIGLLGRRISLSGKIGRLKKKRKLPVVDVEREGFVLKRVRELAEEEGVDPLMIQEIYQGIIHLSRKAQGEGAEVAFLGPKGTFCEQAARKYFRKDFVTFREKSSIPDVFRAVSAGEAAYGVVPVENSIEGSVNVALDLLMESGLKVCGEIEEKVRHNLIAPPGIKQDDVRVIVSHPQAIAQCRKYLEINFSGVRLKEANSTAQAVKRLGNTRNTAAIGTELSAKLYGMRVMAKGIEDDPNNYTRFFVLGQMDADPTGSDKTSIVFSVPHLPGALCRALQTLSEKGINLTKIESRPARTALWEYVFYCDFEGHRREEGVAKALEVLREKCMFLKILGSYPKAGSS